MPSPRPLPRALIGTPLLFRERLDWDVTRARLRASDIAHPFHSVHLAGRTPEGVWELAHAFAPLLTQGEGFSHTTAAVLFDAQLPRQHDHRLHVTSAGKNRIRHRGVIGHRAQVLPLTVLDVLPVVEPAHVWFQLASMLVHRDLVAVGDRWVTPQGRGAWRRPAVTSLERLRDAVAAHPGERGSARARRALAAVRVGPESRMETLLRLLLIESGLPEPLIQPPMRIGDRVLHPDLAFAAEHVVVEYEGDGHRTDQRQWRRDMQRREAFESAGERVIQVHAGDLAEPEALLARICRILAQRR